MGKKVAVYICSGCGIGDCIDTKTLCDVIKTRPDICVCKSHPFLCSDKGLEMLHDDISNIETSAMVIGACSPRVHASTFNLSNDIFIDRVNLREQVAWCSAPNSEDTQMMAEDYINMGIAKCNSVTIPEPYIEDGLSSDILVIGGGISGITAAIEGAKAGYEILLVEKEDILGGWANKLHLQLPLSHPYNDLIKPLIPDKIEKIKRFNNINILTSAEIENISGQPGNFHVQLVHESSCKSFSVASIVMATGWKPYDIGKSGLHGYGRFINVISNIDLENLAKEGRLNNPSNNKMLNNVVFLQCAGSRDSEHLNYCSTFCCATTLKQARYIRESNKDANIYIVYKDIRTPGLLENFYKEIQSDNRIFFTKGTIDNVTEQGDQLIIEIENLLVDEKFLIEADLLVLATGMTPSNTEDLKLNYRLGQGLPELKYEFPDSHFICFPYESRRTGIYPTGALRAPMDMTACIEDAGGAMLKAIQCLEAVKRGESVHPRSGDRSYPKLYLNRCTDCKRCTEECPFGTYDENEKGTPIVNPNRCRRCGICLGACPERIIDFDDFSINSISSVIKSIKIPDEYDEKPRILVFLCENDAYPAFDMAGVNRLRYSPFIRIIPVRCIGSINKVWISDALSRGFDGILQVGCKPGDDYQCHFIHGSELTEKRSENIQEVLEKMMLEEERIRTEFIEINEYHKVPEIINNYVELIEEIGPNPFKDL